MTGYGQDEDSLYARSEILLNTPTFNAFIRHVHDNRVIVAIFHNPLGTFCHGQTMEGFISVEPHSQPLPLWNTPMCPRR